MELRLKKQESPYVFPWPDQREEYETHWRYELVGVPSDLKGGEVSIASGWRQAFGYNRRRILVFRNQAAVLVEFVGVDAWERTKEVIWQIRQKGNSRNAATRQDVPREYDTFEVVAADAWITGPMARRGQAIRLRENDHAEMIHVGLIRESQKRAAQGRPAAAPPRVTLPEATPARPGAMRTPGRITELLLEYSRTVPPPALVPTVVPEAAGLVVEDDFAFVLATCLDRGTRAEIIWTIPFYLRQRLGHLDPVRMGRMTEEELLEALRAMPHRPRYLSAAPRTIRDLCSIVNQECGGDASRIWSGKQASQVTETLQRIHGVGMGIANMAVVLLERTRGVQFTDLDHRTMAIKPDVHTVRVLHRLGASEALRESDAIAAARRLHPDYPGELDTPLWMIGREWCHARSPNCGSCPMTGECPRVGVA